MNAEASNNSNSLSLGLALVGIATFALYFSKDISDTGLGTQGGLGPRAFPIGLSIFLLLSGVYQVGHWGMAKLYDKKPLEEAAARSGSGEPSRSTPIGWSDPNVLIVIAAMAIYIPAISWLGFSLSSWIIASALMIRLGTRWWTAALTAAMLIVAIKLLFLYLFKVQLPAGTLGLPF
jgi:hypothetical protein